MASRTIQSSFEDSLISFSHDLYNLTDGTTSVCMSPYSIISALLMLMIGTRGTSKTQIKTAIFNNTMNDDEIYEQYKSLSSKGFGVPDFELHIATKLFIMNGFTITDDVRRVAREYFSADIGRKDFSKPKQAAFHMNNYVAKRTNNKIKDLISPSWLNANTVMVLINAIYFKGTWETEFDPKDTKKQKFYLSSKKTINVDMMAMNHYMRYCNLLDFTAIALQYKGKQYEMVIVLPKKLDGLHDLKKSFSPDIANQIESNFVNTSVIIRIPKFTFGSETNLKIQLPKLGISDIFVDNKADFSNLVKERNDIYVSEARHKVVIEVNEQGTEAAAGTVIVTVFKSESTQPRFTADHPFLFYIRHRVTGSILFIGHYNPPE